MSSVRALTAALLLCLLAPRAATAARAWQAGDATDHILVQWREDGGGRTAAKERDSLHAAAGGRFLDRAPLLDIERIALPAAAGGADVDRALALYRASPLVAAAEPDGPARAAAAAWPDDSVFAAGLQWGLTRTAWTRAYAAWQAGQIVLGTRITVAVLDSGVDAHADLAPQLLAGASEVASEPSTDDNNGHGTMCAGLIAATPANGSGIAGAFFDPALVRILPVKVLDACGGGSDSTISYGLLYAAQHGARVANLSVVLAGTNDVVRAAVTEAARRGMVLVAAVGNDQAAVPYPAALPDVISVSALDPSDAPAFYVNHGKVDLSAPGGAGAVACQCAFPPSPSSCPSEIWSLTAQQNGCVGVNNACPVANRLEGAAGTSFAAPLVAAAAALLLSQDPGLDAHAVLERLLQSVEPTSEGPGFHARSGWGKLDFYKALTQVRPGGGSSPLLRAWSYPNPFNPDKDALCTFNVQLPRAGEAKLRLLDGGGDTVRSWTLGAGEAWAGPNLLTWDGRNGAGRTVANGAYLLVVESGGARCTHRVAVLR